MSRMIPFGSLPIWSRRGWLKVMPGLWLGLETTPRVTTAASAAFTRVPRVDTVLFVIVNGGQSQLDTWDPKPLAPLEVRGEFCAIPTSVPGTWVCEHLPLLAQRAHRYALIRTMSHEDLDHGSALYLLLTGQYHSRRSSNPPPAETDWPTHAAVVKRLRPAGHFLEPAVHLNGPALIPILPSAGQNGGFLGRAWDPLVVGEISSASSPWPVLQPWPEVSSERRQRRRRLLEQLETHAAHPQPANDYARHLERAWQLLERLEVQQAFELQQEPVAVRERYGQHRSGQACLLARRLVEAGVSWITLFWNHTGRGQDRAPHNPEEYGWDTHNDIFMALRKYLLPRFDQSFSALLDDLEERGLWERTLVVCAGEFGRAPLVALEKNFAGESPGRKHWSACYSVLVAGGGVQGGRVLGRSDSRGAYPLSEKYGPWDLAATMYAALGFDPAGHFVDARGQQHPLTAGRPIAALY